MPPPEIRVVAIPYRALQADGLLGHLHDLLHPVQWHVHFLGNFFRRRLVAEFLDELLLDLDDLV